MGMFPNEPRRGLERTFRASFVTRLLLRELTLTSCLPLRPLETEAAALPVRFNYQYKLVNASVRSRDPILFDLFCPQQEINSNLNYSGKKWNIHERPIEFNQK